MADQPMPYVKLALFGSDGTAEKPVGAPIMLQVPRQMSLKLAKMYVAEAMGQALKGEAIENALKAIGCK